MRPRVSQKFLAAFFSRFPLYQIDRQMRLLKIKTKEGVVKYQIMGFQSDFHTCEANAAFAQDSQPNPESFNNLQTNNHSTKPLLTSKLSLIGLTSRTIWCALVLFACVSLGRAQGFVGFGGATEYDSGFNPSVAISGTTVVEVHNGQAESGPMWYHVGQVYDSTTITWGPAYNYDTGFNPSVAISGTTVVEVHNGQGEFGPMWYHVGQVSGSTIEWGPYYNYDTGWNPSVAISGSTVVEVHNGQGGDGPMWYHVGTINGKKITWGPSNSYDWGYNPSVALVGSTAFEVHNGQGGAGPLWYHVGTVGGNQITWGPSNSYDWGWNPKIAAFAANCYDDPPVVMEVHNANSYPGDLWYHYGDWPGGTTLALGPTTEYDWGWNPSIAADSDFNGVVEVHNGQGTFGPMWYHVGGNFCIG